MASKPNYQNTIIYKFVCNDLAITDIYVGATTDINRRKSEHKRRCNNPTCKKHNFKIYQCMRNNGGFSNWEMLEVEKYPCNNKTESCIRERYWLELLNANLNKQIQSRTLQEYISDNKDKISKQKKIYRDKNQEI